MISESIASSDDVDIHVGAVAELRIDQDEAAKLARDLQAYADELVPHVHDLVTGVTSLNFSLDR